MGERVLGFVGLGRMGVPMSGRLAAAGHPVVGFDVAGTSGRLSEGVQAAESVVVLCRRASIVFLSLPDGAASRDVCGQIAAAHGQAEVVVDLSTIGTMA